MMGIDINTDHRADVSDRRRAGRRGGHDLRPVQQLGLVLSGLPQRPVRFTAAVMGGIGNIQGAFLGGMLIGIVAAISRLRVMRPALDRRRSSSALLVLILIFRPTRPARRRDHRAGLTIATMAAQSAQSAVGSQRDRQPASATASRRRRSCATRSWSRSSSSWRSTRCSTSRSAGARWAHSRPS